MNKYYQAFKKNVSWFNHKNKPIEVFEINEFGLTNRFQELFPKTTQLINSSIKTGVELNGKAFVLFTWEIQSNLCGWMSQFDRQNIDLIEEHTILIDNIGGIKESFNGPNQTTINGINYNYSLTQNQYFLFVGSLCYGYDKLDWKDYYTESCLKSGSAPLDLTKKVIFTREGNGSEYYYDRETKKVNLFSPDHNYNYATFIPNQPEYTIHEIKGVNSFVDFVELLSSQWITHLEKRGSSDKRGNYF